MRFKFLNYITRIAILAALSIVLYYVKFPLLFFPSFLEIQFSNVPVILGSFLLGPAGGCIIVLIRFLVKLLSTRTLGVGELSDLVIGVSVALSSGIIYRFNRTKKGGIFALVACMVTWVVIATLSNWLFIMPTYIKAFGFNAVFGMLKVIPGITETNYMTYYIWFAVVPFNLLLATLVCFITYFIYKSISIIFKKDFFQDKKVLAICDSFKGSATSKEVNSAVRSAVNSLKISCDVINISDGGEGFLDCLESFDANLVRRSYPTKDALNRDNNASFLIDEKNQILYFELAEVVGIKDLKAEELDCMNASTYGLGLLIKQAIIELRPKKVIIGIGGSASTDAGIGMLCGMGLKAFDEDGNEFLPLGNAGVARLASYEKGELDKLIKGISFEVFTDVENPLLGENGAAYIFGPQKGASPEDVVIMNQNLCKLVKTNHLDFVANKSGSGAAGGVGFGASVFLKAELKSGIEEIFNMGSIAKKFKDYATIFTGEGCLDETSLGTKVVGGVLRAVGEKNALKKVVIICGKKEIDVDYQVYQIVPAYASLDESLANPLPYIEKIVTDHFEKKKIIN